MQPILYIENNLLFNPLKVLLIYSPSNTQSNWHICVYSAHEHPAIHHHILLLHCHKQYRSNQHHYIIIIRQRTASIYCHVLCWQGVCKYITLHETTVMELSKVAHRDLTAGTELSKAAHRDLTTVTELSKTAHRDLTRLTCSQLKVHWLVLVEKSRIVAMVFWSTISPVHRPFVMTSFVFSSLDNPPL